MKTRVRKWGNSLAVRIPQAFADEVNLSNDSEVDLSIEGCSLIVSPVKPRRRSKYTMRELVDQIRDDQLHPEIDPGPSVGAEEW